VKVERLVLGPIDTNCWLVSDGAGGPLIVIDPAGDAPLLLDAVGDSPVEAVVLTHAHFDHLGAVRALMEATGAPLMVHRLDADAAADPSRNLADMIGEELCTPMADRILEDGDEVRAGGVTLRVLLTPGHTPGSICLYAPGHLISGDTLFAGSVGRTDLPGGDARALAASIREKLAGLPDGTRVHPGHGDETTIGRERMRNIFWPRS
jgi:glyoxylase-like metal-dependent hydrolase (beta-lactamase superfamily II)